MEFNSNLKMAFDPDADIDEVFGNIRLLKVGITIKDNLPK